MIFSISSVPGTTSYQSLRLRHTHTSVPAVALIPKLLYSRSTSTITVEINLGGRAQKSKFIVNVPSFLEKHIKETLGSIRSLCGMIPITKIRLQDPILEE